MKRFLVLVVLCMTSAVASAAIETHEFNNELDRKRYQSFVEDMRCPKCQNQNLAGSDAPISADLRQKIYEMIQLGKSDKEIVDFMVERYGDFILYRPRVTPATYALWGAPLFLLIVGVIVLILILRRRRRLALEQSNGSLSADEKARLENLLNSTDSKKDDEEPRS